MTLGGLPNPVEILEQIKREEAARKQEEAAQKAREEAARKERERQERERKIRQEKEKLEAQLQDARKTRAKVEEKAAQAASYAQSLAVSLQTAIKDLTAATNGTHVGTSQFCSAASSALNKANAIYNALKVSGNSGSNSQSGATSSGCEGSSSETMIHVAPEIAGGRSAVRQVGEDISFINISLIMHMALVSNQSNALKTASNKMMGFTEKLGTLASQTGRMASDITAVYDNYHTAQQKAIYLAEMIPK